MLTDQLLQQIAAAAASTDFNQTFPKQAFNWLAEAGLLQITIPGDTTQTQLRTGDLLRLLKQIGAANLSVGRIYEGHINALLLIDLYGNAQQKQHWFNEVSEEQKLFGVWNTQAENGVKIHDLGNGKYRLEGCKTFCSGSRWINRPLITGELISATKSGWQMCIIPTEKVKTALVDESFWQPLGMRASVSFKMDFTGIELNESDLLGAPGDYYRQPYFSGGAIRFAAVQIGGADAVFIEVKRFLQQLNRTGDGFQQARVAEMAVLAETGNLWLNAAAAKFDQWKNDPDPAKLLAYTGMFRTIVAEICNRILQLAGDCVGARGLMAPNTLERIFRDLNFYLKQPAPDATKTQIGHYVLNQQKDDFGY